jgi:hypothetical protein
MFPTNAGIPELETLFVGEFDDEASPLGAKGLGELTTVSVVPATITNAVYHATGKRIREICRSHWKSFHKGRSRTTGSAVHLPRRFLFPIGMNHIAKARLPRRRGIGDHAAATSLGAQEGREK